MQRYLLTIFALLFSLGASAQPYRCLQPGARNYFVNGNHYLRGMRIDSVRVSGTATLFYPFRTPRKPRIPTAPYRPIDTAGGSWLGKEVVELPDGVTLFDNWFGDTVVINTRAGIGDPWMFYDDTSAVYYTAEVTAIDTMTVLGIRDSVKTIQLTAMSGGGVVNGHPLNSYTVLLSRDHGFVRIFDLYTFPYHTAVSSTASTRDYLLALNRYDLPGSAMFDLISVSNPSYTDLYDWAVGDVRQYSAAFYGPPSSPPDWISMILTNSSDSVISRSVDSAGVHITYLHWEQSRTIYSGPTPTKYGNGGGWRTKTIPLNTTCFIIDTFRMPEEWAHSFIYYYDPADTSYCLTSPLYRRKHFTIIIPLDGPGDESETFKVGIGMLDSANGFSWGPSLDLVARLSQKMGYVQVNGNRCGKYLSPLTVAPAAATPALRVFPNPATDELFVSVSDGSYGSYEVELQSLSGAVLYRHSGAERTLRISVGDYPGGLYMLRVTVSGAVSYQKVVIAH